MLIFILSILDITGFCIYTVIITLIVMFHPNNRKLKYTPSDSATISNMCMLRTSRRSRK